MIVKVIIVMFFLLISPISFSEDYIKTRSDLTYKILVFNLMKSTCRNRGNYPKVCEGARDGSDILVPLWYFGQLKFEYSYPHIGRISNLLLDGEAASEFVLVLERANLLKEPYISGVPELKDECVDLYEEIVERFSIPNVSVSDICKE